MKFAKTENMWWNIQPNGDDTYSFKNYYGGSFSSKLTEDMEILDAENWHDLDWNNTDINNPKYKIGWLDREGNFFGLRYGLHSLSAEIIFKKTERRLEELGFIKITGKNIISAKFDYRHIPTNVYPTDAQLSYLLTRNDVNNEEILKAIEKRDNFRNQINMQI